ncbi:phosphodiesterase [Dietzia maris]|uniref:phosphodiesterase n=1 Tax=Dietzia TaxID=37914 RepID=UPI000804BA70|nr:MULTISPECIES: phosphodiesterase [Dietzia]MBB0997310.1 phosphodiesterase [Dietzia maris]MCZ4539767.1 phosphodiesterase [Dietzia maris]MCZ4656754.1 phosphodiesterase [Dietzia kunjamensis]OAV78668.1 phosphodiesterase [Dietzia sp. 111N12-1]
MSRRTRNAGRDDAAASSPAEPSSPRSSALVPTTTESKEVALRSAPLSSLAGSAFGAVAAVARLARPKALHPKGVIAEATLSVTGVGRTGSSLLDVTGRWPATIRFSRAVGLPDAVPDIGGMAVRIHAERPVDILLASTGTGPLSRYVLTTGWRTMGRTMTSMFPVLIAGRPLLLAAIPTGDGGTWTLQHATPLGKWKTLGRITVDSWEDDDENLHFDPIGNRLPGSRYPNVLRALRDPSYPPADRGA